MKIVYEKCYETYFKVEKISFSSRYRTTGQLDQQASAKSI